MSAGFVPQLVGGGTFLAQIDAAIERGIKLPDYAGNVVGLKRELTMCAIPSAVRRIAPAPSYAGTTVSDVA